jgi:hypothetical protein
VSGPGVSGPGVSGPGVTGRAVLVPGVLALLPRYGSLTDPVADLRRACRDAVAWLCEPGGPVTILGGEQGERVARHLLSEVAARLIVEAEAPTSVLAVGNGSASHTEKAPGHLDPRAHAFDAALAEALTRPDPVALGQLDHGLGAELLADVTGPAGLAAHLTSRHAVEVDYDDNPFGVQYWVMRWTCAS